MAPKRSISRKWQFLENDDFSKTTISRKRWYLENCNLSCAYNWVQRAVIPSILFWLFENCHWNHIFYLLKIRLKLVLHLVQYWQLTPAACHCYPWYLHFLLLYHQASLGDYFESVSLPVCPFDGWTADQVQIKVHCKLLHQTAVGLLCPKFPALLLTRLSLCLSLDIIAAQEAVERQLLRIFLLRHHNLRSNALNRKVNHHLVFMC